MKKIDVQKYQDDVSLAEKAINDKQCEIEAINSKLDNQYEYIEHIEINAVKAAKELSRLRREYFKEVAELRQLLTNYRYDIGALERNL